MHDSQKNLSDSELFNLCRQYGANALLWRRKFAGLLPEVMRRKLYARKGFTSIFEFAAKLAGMSEEQVRRVLNLQKKFEDKPELKRVLENGEVSTNKLARIASIVTPENQEFLADQVKLLPQRALETLVRDEKFALAEFDSEQKLFQMGVRAHTKEPQLADDVKNALAELQEKGIDINNLIREMLAKRDSEIMQEKEKLAAEQNDLAKSAGAIAKRYIPAKIKKILQAEHGTKCSIQGCKKPAEEIHHTQRFALARAHDPRYMAPLCKEHHIIAQTIDIKYIQVRQNLLK